MSIIVPGFGPSPNRVMLIGEAPGQVESIKKRPFAGPSGEEQEWHLRPHGLTAYSWYLTNLRKTFIEGNPDPTPDEITHWTPTLEEEIRKCRPQLIIAAGRYAARWLIGDGITMEDCYGQPHRPGELDPSVAYRACGAIILPIYHPAFGLHQETAKSLVSWCYGQVADTLHKLKIRAPIEFPYDEYPNPEYLDLSGTEAAHRLSIDNPDWIAIDTEGTPWDRWSIQVSPRPGVSYVVRCSRDDFWKVIAQLQAMVDRGVGVVVHCAKGPEISFYDIVMCRAMGLELRRARLFDTMTASYLAVILPQGLKPLSWRFNRVKLHDYEGLVEGLAKDKQVEYLKVVASRKWPKPETQIIYENDGSISAYTPDRIESGAKRIVSDVESGKVNKDGPTKPHIRWAKLDKKSRKIVEAEMGPFPTATLADVHPDDATQYAGGDSDHTLRLMPKLSKFIGTPVTVIEGGRQRIVIPDRAPLMADCMAAYPMFEEMAATGMPGVYSEFAELHDFLRQEMSRLQSTLSYKFFDGKPFNPNSPPQKIELLKKYRLRPMKRTKTGQPSTSKKSIEYLSGKNEVIRVLFEWGERYKLDNTFVEPIMDMFEPGEEQRRIKTNIKTTQTATLRPASTDPNLLNIPKRTALGKRVRKCYKCKDGEVILSGDLSQIEVRVLAHLSRDPLLIKFFLEGRDIHRETAALIFGIDPDKVTSDQRRAAKTANFGVIYGLGAYGLMLNLWSMGLTTWTEPASADLIRGVFDVYPGVEEYIGTTKQQVYRDGVVLSMCGMPRYMPEIRSKDRAKAAEAGRQAVNHTIQTTAQWMIQKSMGWMAPRLWELQDCGMPVEAALQIYDDLDFLVDEEWEYVVADLLRTALVDHCGVELLVPVECEIKSAKSWGDLD